MFIKRSIKFNLHKRKASDTTDLAIRMRVTISGERPFDFPLGRKIDLDQWDAEIERVTPGAKDAAEINRTIEEYKAQINEVFARYELIEKRVPNKEEVRMLFYDMIGRKSIFEEEYISVKSAFDEYINTVGKKNSWAEATLKKNNTVRKHFLSVIKDKPFQAITTELLQTFIDTLLSQGLKNTTIHKDYQFVRFFLRWARKKKYYNGNADIEFKPKLKGTDGNHKEIIYLSLEELRQLQEYHIPDQKNYLKTTRDIFLFCCYTSLRYSDVRALRKSDIHGNAIHIVTQKTDDGLTIELNSKARAILDKYADAHLPNDAALPVISNQKYNMYLKELGELAGLDTPSRIVYYRGNKRYDEYYPKYALITSHCARRTFVVTALQLGIPVEVIIRWTGHSDYDAMKPYVAIVDELKRKEMNKFDLL